jgi:hypothetical protein
VDDVDAGPEANGLAGALRSEPELPAHRPQIPRRRHLPLELDRPTIDDLAVGAGVDSPLSGRRGLRPGDGGEAAGQPEPQQLSLLGRGGPEALGRRDRRPGLERLVRPRGVVIAHPVIERGLCLQQRRERACVVEQLPAQRLMEALDLARGGRRARRREPMRDPIAAADLVEQHLRAAPEAIAELLAIIGQALAASDATQPPAGHDR